jgi:hypothetical protein
MNLRNEIWVISPNSLAAKSLALANIDLSHWFLSVFRQSAGRLPNSLPICANFD